MPNVMVSLDVSEVDMAEMIIRKTGATAFKIGLELLYHPNGVAYACEVARNWTLFLDSKLSDIPTTVERSVRQICTHIAPDLLSVRTSVDAAVEAATGKTKIAAVPYLTTDLWAAAITTSAPAIVCSPGLADNVRHMNPKAVIICPGVRLDGDDRNDHVGSTSMPAAADYVVVGRPITRSLDPRAAYERYLGAARTAGRRG